MFDDEMKLAMMRDLREDAYSIVDWLRLSENDDIRRAFCEFDMSKGDLEFAHPKQRDKWSEMYAKRCHPVYALSPEQSERWNELISPILEKHSGATWSHLIFVAHGLIRELTA